jgi:N-acyl-D-aspartate/D-glutamate deacylase
MQALQLKASVLHKNLDEKLIARALASKRSLIASASPSFADRASGMKHFKSDRITSTFSAFLAFAEKQEMPFEDAVRKITETPAKKFGITGRGAIAEGNFADLVCLRGGEVKFTIVNGRVVEKENEFQGPLAGNILRHPKIKIADKRPA